MNLNQFKEPHRIVDSIGWRAKQELIWLIQEKRGGTPCFQTGKEFCDQFECCWRGDCQVGMK
jgi:hypothetical protein